MVCWDCWFDLNVASLHSSSIIFSSNLYVFIASWVPGMAVALRELSLSSVVSTILGPPVTLPTCDLVPLLPLSYEF